jgi:hypothetical protein
MKTPYERYERYSLDFAVLGKPKKKSRKFYFIILAIIFMLGMIL